MKARGFRLGALGILVLSYTFCMITEGSAFPDFELQDQEGKSHRLADLKGKKSVLFFYPKDDTSG